ncbi:ankyrin repeat containing protein [Theileria orientalis strain Shintoku]|uniref:Ankyrin repeat containing protein n=1 Tax=Theileria orientalis strain Shintoku TaxID=869250 RepID=J4CDY3_THEOR|nr:ankyrin repeat containing protein [Theileria orientalis strain Shintoku]BAM41942.1 ankyrin repeat containing protein [Theileria orientalis strain Shintoku]|eukprot:XP_009692243.1 ankyrin repeat containing protein [Theileria orientalis strain Shintoku]
MSKDNEEYSNISSDKCQYNTHGLNSKEPGSVSGNQVSDADNDPLDLSKDCERCLYITSNSKKLDSAFTMNLKHTNTCKKLESTHLDSIKLSKHDLEVLKDEMFDSIANTQLQQIISNSASNASNPRSVEPENSKSANASDAQSSLVEKEGPASTLSSIPDQPSSEQNLKKFDKYLDQNISNPNLRQGHEDNEVWKHTIKRIEPFLDVYSLLMLRQTCKTLYYHKYKLRSHATLSFRGFAGFDSKWIFETILPLVHHVLDLPDNCKIRFDFTGCILLKDICTVYLLKSNMITNNFESRQYARNVRELVFDFCHQITDKSLEVMLATKMPNLQRLSLTCCRNENFTGLPFVRGLSRSNWPKFNKFRCTFSNIFLEPLQTIADFIYRSMHTSDTLKTLTNYTSLNSLSTGNYSDVSRPSSINNATLTFKEEVKKDRNDSEEIEFEICGSWGSRRLLDKLGFGIYCTTFTNALKSNNYNMCSKLTKKLQAQLSSLSEQANMKDNSCLALTKNRGSELLVNCPITVKDRSHNNVGIWTLPILLVIHQQNMDMFMLLIKRGARLNVWDSLNKSPLLIACELGFNNFVEKIVKFTMPPIPYDNSRHIPLIVAISNSNVPLVKLLLKENFDINYRCPSIKHYKSPLYVACEHYNLPIIKLLLEKGADPNWKYKHRSTPTLLGYQQDPKPLIAVCKLNKIKIVEMLLSKRVDLNTFDSFGTTPLHAACEEANLEIASLLLEHDAQLDAQDVFGRTPLHMAILENKPQVVALLLERGARLDLKEYSCGETPLMTAIRTRNEQIATLIVKSRKVDPSTVDYHGKNLNYYLQFYKMNKLEVYLTPTSV